jgi:hypothetical protein
MRYFKIVATLMFCVFLSGCIQSDTAIRVKPDGSGVIVETVLLSKMLVESLQSFSKGLAEEGATKDETADKDQGEVKGKKEGEDPIKAIMKDAESRAKQYGPDVKFVSATPVKSETMMGYKAVYSFKDINMLRINQNPENKAGKPAESKDQPQKKEEIILFTLVKGPVSKLIVKMPKEKDGNKATNDAQKSGKQAENPPDPSAEEMMKVMFKDMGIGIAIEIDGTIIKTNATYRDKSRLTLLDMQFGKIIENKAVFDKLNAAQPKTIEEMKELVKGIKGLKIELNNPVVVEFR